MRRVADQRDAVRRRPRLLLLDRMERPGQPRAGHFQQSCKARRGAAHCGGEDAGIAWPDQPSAIRSPLVKATRLKASPLLTG